MELCLVDVGPNGRDCYVVREPDCNENENLEGRKSTSLWRFIWADLRKKRCLLWWVGNMVRWCILSQRHPDLLLCCQLTELTRSRVSRHHHCLFVFFWKKELIYILEPFPSLPHSCFPKFYQDIPLEKGLATFSSKYSSLHIFFFFWKMFIPGQHMVQDRSRHIVVFVGSRRLFSTSHVRVVVEMLTWLEWYDGTTAKPAYCILLMRPVNEGIKEGILLSMGSANFSTVNMYYSCGSHVAAPSCYVPNTTPGKNIITTTHRFCPRGE